MSSLQKNFFLAIRATWAKKINFQNREVRQKPTQNPDFFELFSPLYLHSAYREQSQSQSKAIPRNRFQPSRTLNNPRSRFPFQEIFLQSVCVLWEITHQQFRSLKNPVFEEHYKYSKKSQTWSPRRNDSIPMSFVDFYIPTHSKQKCSGTDS